MFFKQGNPMTNVIEIIETRGLLEAVTEPRVRDWVQSPATVYAGFDPTSSSLQVGNLVAIMGLAHFQRCGHKVIAVVGGATGMIGDPSGKTGERPVLSADEIERNLVGIRENLARLLDLDHPAAPAKIAARSIPFISRCSAASGAGSPWR